MKSLLNMKPTLMEWRRRAGPGLAYDLHTAEGIAASLVFPDRGSTLARVETAEGTWTIMHPDLLNPVTTVRVAGATDNLALFHPHALRHGSLEFSDGVAYDWAALDGTPAGGAFLSQAGTPLVRLHPRLGLEPIQDLESGMVELGHSPQQGWRHGILAALGWYLLVLDHFKENPEHAAEFSLRL